MREVEVVGNVPCRTGEGPVWHEQEQALYWMDIPNGHLFRLRPNSSSPERLLHGPVLGGLTVQRDGGLVLLGMHGAVMIWKENTLYNVVPTIAALRGTRFTDAISDREGRILSGTMPALHRKSSLLLFEHNGNSRVVLEGFGQSNGMAFSADGNMLYHADTRDRVVRLYHYDATNGTLERARELVRFGDTEGAPDGIALDSEGYLWIALWGGGRVVRIDTKGREVDRLTVSTPFTTSVAFGGHNLCDLYITTAGGDDRRANGLMAGSLFRTEVQVPGIAPPRSALKLPTERA